MNKTLNLFVRMGVGLFLILIASIVFIKADVLPPTTLEPLGPSAIPQAIAVIVIILSLLYVAGAFIDFRKQPSEEMVTPDFRRRYDLTLVVIILTIAYVSLFGFGLIGFRWATVLFLSAMGLLLTGASRRHIPYILGGALVIGIGIHYLFTQVLIVGLP